MKNKPFQAGKRGAILLDRDGVINREQVDYVKDWQEFAFLPGVLPALRRLAPLHVPIAVITNQSAIGRGIISAKTVTEIHQRLGQAVREVGGRIDAFFVCPHQPSDGCGCRKPQPGLLFQAAHAFQFELAHAIFVGDAITDFEAAHAAGCSSLLVRSGRQGPCLDRFFADAAIHPFIVADLPAAVDLILAAA